MKFTWDNKIIMLLILFVIIIPFWKGTSGNYGQIWENVSIVATIFYAFSLYLAGFYFKKFEGLTEKEKGLIGIIVLLLIPLISLPYIVGFLKIFFVNMDKLYNDYFLLSRSSKMSILLIISILFAFVDYKMLKKANDNKINFATNLFYSDIPVSVAFATLLIYSLFIGNETIKKENLDHFFEGAIAFQMIFSNIIWMYNDDEFWKSIVNNN